MTEQPLISLIVPLYNEANRLSSGVKEIYHYLRQESYLFEIILVNDGSTDQTWEVISKICTLFPDDVKTISYHHNRGKGYALKRGILEARAQFIFFTDIDLSVPMLYLKPFLEKLKEGFPVVIGSRRLEKSEIKVRQPWIRESMGKMFRRITQYLLVPEVSDITCGFKGFEHKTAQFLFSHLTLERWGFDAEVLFLAKKYQFKICEIPVCWSDSSETKVRLLKDSIRSGWELLKIFFNNWKGVYENPEKLRPTS